MTIRHPLKGVSKGQDEEQGPDDDEDEEEEEEEGSGANRKSLSFHGHRCVPIHA